MSGSELLLRRAALSIPGGVNTANGLLIGGVERFWQDVVVGVILVVAVWFDQWRRAKEARDR
jgi:ribose/xylose/arabinose/galactoside ABC-type transport system permease subunit